MLLRSVERAARSLGLPGQPVLVAVSGGVDSTALLWSLQHLASRLDLKLSIGHVNHGLRGADSEADARFVEGLGAKLGLPVRSVRVDPLAARAGGSSRQRPTLQEAARRLRYDALRRIAREDGATRLATAHTADDQAETVMLRLLRGTSPAGLGGIPERSRDGLVVRPLLGVTRQQVVAFAREHGLRWREDRSNQDGQFARNRLRTRLAALASDFNPRLLRAVADLAEAQRRESEWIDAVVERESAARFEPTGAGNVRIEPAGWRELPDALARRLVRKLLHDCGAGRDVSRVHLERTLAFLRNGRVGCSIELPGGLRLTRERVAFGLGRSPGAPEGAC